MRQGNFHPLVLFRSEFASWIFIKNFQTCLEVKIHVNVNRIKLTPCIAYKSLGFLGKLSSLVKRYFPYQTIRLQNQSHVKSDIKKLGDFWKKLWLLAFCAPCSNEYFFVAICTWAPKIKIVFSRSQPMTAQQISINFRPVKSLFERCVEGQNFIVTGHFVRSCDGSKLDVWWSRL